MFNSCMVLNIHPSKNITLKKSSSDKAFYMDLSKVIIFLDTKDVLKIYEKKNKNLNKIVELISERDTIDLTELDSTLIHRYNNEYLKKLLKRGKATIIHKSNNSKIKRIKRKWTNVECNWGYGYFLPEDTTCFFLHYYKLCPY